jgi:tetratricopeptide (TPR) repeat protein
MFSFPITHLVSITLHNGVEKNVLLVLEEQPTRQQQKLNTLSKYVQQHPQGWKKRLELANLLYTMGHWERAANEYDQVLTRQPQLMEARLRMGKILQLLEKPTEAIAVYQCTQALTSHTATVHHMNGLIELCHGRQDIAISWFESAAALEPDNAAHWLILGQIHHNTEAPIAALQAFDTLLERHPDDIIALIFSHDTLVALGYFHQAQQRLNRIRELVPHDFGVLNRLTDHRLRKRLVQGQEGQQTYSLIKVTLKHAPVAAEHHKSLAYYYIFLGQWQTGVAILHRFVEQYPNNYSGWYYYARSLFHTGDYSSAAEAILRAHTLYQNDSEIYRATCDILPKAGQLEKLPILITQMLKRFPERWSVWVMAGQVLVEHFQDYKQLGCSLSAKGPQLQPQLTEPWFRHGRVLALAGKPQAAIEALEQGWQKLPEADGYVSVPAAVWLGQSYQTLGEDAKSRFWWEQAYEQAKKLTDLDPAMAYYWSGKVLAALGEKQQAQEAYQTALNYQLLYPIVPKVNKALSQL